MALTPKQQRVLRALPAWWDRNPVDAYRLGLRLGMRPQAVGRVLHALRRKGLVLATDTPTLPEPAWWRTEAGHQAVRA